MTVVYFNIPEAYFRSLDRHYLPVGVTFAVLVAYGLASIAASVTTHGAAAQSIRVRAIAGAAAALSLVPLAQLGANWTARNASANYFARDFATNALEALPENAIYITVGDNDTFPVLYAQTVEHVRPDVRILNLSLASTEWFLGQLERQDPDFPLALSPDQRHELIGTPGDTTIAVPVADSPRDTVVLRVAAQYGSQRILSDVVLLDLIATNQWRRPITIAATGGAGLEWLTQHARLDGLHWTVVPGGQASRDTEPLRANLLERYQFRGYADSAIVIEPETRLMAFQHLRAFAALMDADTAAGRLTRCRDAAARLLAVMPPERMIFPGYDRPGIEARCPSTE
jgi:hypothetical protein